MHFTQLAKKTYTGIAKLFGVMTGLLFISAGTVNYPQSWLFLFVFFTGAIVFMTYFLEHDPALVRRRMHAGPAAETLRRQKQIMSYAAVLFVLLLAVPGIEYRLGNIQGGFLSMFVGNALIVQGYYIIYKVFRENSYAASIITTESQQPVISTGPYKFVRHPMYSGGIVLLFGIPLALASYKGLWVAAGLTLVIIWRLLEEEEFLAQNLPGYSEYCIRTPHRLIPGIF